MPTNIAGNDTSFADVEKEVVQDHSDLTAATGEDLVESDAGPAVGKAGEVEGDAAPTGGDAGEATGDTGPVEGGEEEEKEGKKRRGLFLLLLLLLLLLCCVGAMFYRYLRQPAPLPDLLPVPVDLDYTPHYLFSIYGLDRPVGVALSPDAERLYVTETGGERLVRIFSREGDPLGSFAPPRTRPAQRSPVYLAVDSAGRLFVSDRLQHAIYVYDGDGNYLDTILAPNLTLYEYVVKHAEEAQPGFEFAYNVFWPEVLYRNPGEQTERTLPSPDIYTWAPLGLHFDAAGNLLLTDVDASRNGVREIPADVIGEQPWDDFDPPLLLFGESGQGNGQMLFPNAAVRALSGKIYVTDGNNGRVTVWDDQGVFLFHFGQGTGPGALNLPRGADISTRDRLHVVDAVGQDVKVYDVSGEESEFLFAFGSWGRGDGQFDYPNDIVLDASGRLYIADRENNRIQVWSY